MTGESSGLMPKAIRGCRGTPIGVGVSPHLPSLLCELFQRGPERTGTGGAVEGLGESQSGIGAAAQKSRVKQKTRTILADHPGLCSSETSGEPSVSKWFEYSCWPDWSQ